jgi:hypothetical protein
MSVSEDAEEVCNLILSRSNRQTMGQLENASTLAAWGDKRLRKALKWLRDRNRVRRYTEYTQKRVKIWVYEAVW